MPATVARDDAGADNYGSPEPLIGVVTDLVPVKVENNEVNYMSATALKDIQAFYTAHYTKLGLTERAFVTSVYDTGFSIVFDGLPDGSAMVVQAVVIGPGQTNVNVSKRKE